MCSIKCQFALPLPIKWCTSLHFSHFTENGSITQKYLLSTRGKGRKTIEKTETDFQKRFKDVMVCWDMVIITFVDVTWNYTGDLALVICSIWTTYTTVHACWPWTHHSCAVSQRQIRIERTSQWSKMGDDLGDEWWLNDAKAGIPTITQAIRFGFVC